MPQAFRRTSPCSRRCALLGLVVGVAVWPVRGNAQGTPSKADREFLAWDIQIEIQQQDMGRLAERRGQTADVRALGTYLVREHRQAETELLGVADRLGLRLSEVLSPTHLGVQRHYASVPVEHFDRAFVRHEVGDYRYFLRHFEAAAHVGNPDIRRYVAAQLPHLRDGQRRVGSLMIKLHSG